MAVVIIGIGAFAAGCGKYSISNIRSLKAFQDANTLYRKNEFKAAIARYEDAVRFNPDLGFAYFFLGNSYDNLYKPARKGEPENDSYLPKAVENYRLAIDKMRNATDPKEQEIRKLAYEYLIAAYGNDKLADFAQAEPVAKEMIQLNPNEPSNYQTLGRLYEDQGMYEQAEAMFKKAVEIKPNDPLGHMVLAGYYNRQGDFEKTMEAFNARAAVEPNNPEAWHTMGTYYQDKVLRDKELSRAKGLEYTLKGIEAEDRALALNSQYVEALIFKNILLLQQANFEKDPAKQKALVAEADRLKTLGLELQKKQNAAAGSADTGKDKGKDKGSN
jgi:tetratricopeptide (TPR) repeat protein